MKTYFSLNNNKGYFWVRDNSQYIRGRVWYENSEQLIDRIPLLSDGHVNYSNYNGCFCIVEEDDDMIYILSDKYRSMPVFYAVYNNVIYVSDSAEKICGVAGLHIIDNDLYDLYRHAGFVPGRETLVKGIYQTLAGELVKINKNTGSIFNYKYYNYYKSKRYEVVDYNNFYKTIVSLAAKVSNMFKGKKVYIPLSQGTDSKLIAIVMKLANIEDVVCYTYGKPNAKEIDGSKYIAKVLGLEWKLIPYSNKTWKALRSSSDFKEYLKYAGNLSNFTHIQDYPAVAKLLEGMVPEEKKDIVFVPGHTGAIGGGNLAPKIFDKNEFPKKYNYSIYGKKDFNLWNCGKTIIKKSDYIMRQVEKINNQDRSSAIEFYQTWDIQERQSKYIINSVKIYEMFGAQWFLPLIDTDLMELLYNMSDEQRIGKVEYKKFVERLFSEVTGIAIRNKKQDSVLTRLLKNILRESVIYLSKKYQILFHDLCWFSLFGLRDKLIYFIHNGDHVSALIVEKYLNIIGLG